MANFDQRGQQVVNQVNAESIGSVNFGSIQNKAEFVAELQKLLFEINKATQAGIIKKDVSTAVESHVKEAVIEIAKPEPKKKSILEHIEAAKGLLDGVVSATGLVTALIEAAKIAQGIFL